jgi:hypothetical protein
MFVANIPPMERPVRVLLGLAIACVAWFAAPGNALAFASGLGVAATGLVGFCPACALAGRRL